MGSMGCTSELRTSTGFKGAKSGCLSAVVVSPAAVTAACGIPRLRGRPAWRPTASTLAGTSEVWGAGRAEHATLDEAVFLSTGSARPSLVANWVSAARRSYRLKTWPSGYQAVQESLEIEIVSIVRPPDGLTASVSHEPSAYWASIPALVLRNTPMPFPALRASDTVPTFSLLNSTIIFSTPPFTPPSPHP